MGIDFSKQPDNELWYITTDGRKSNSVLPTYGGQTMTLLSHTYENGIGKITYKEGLVDIGQRVLQDNNLLLISMPKKVTNINPYCCNCIILILLGNQKVDLSSRIYFGKDSYSKLLCVQPNCSKYYKENYPSINIIEKRI